MGFSGGSSGVLDGSITPAKLSSAVFESVDRKQLEQDLNILINAIASSSTLNDWEDVFLDIFTDADGNDNTIDTGNTTAEFDTNKYKNALTNIDADHGLTLDNADGTYTYKAGIVGQFDNEVDVVSVTKPSSSTATTAYIQTAKGSGVVATATFSGNVATFSSPYTCAANTDYFFETDAGGASWNFYNKAATLPISNNGFNFNACFQNNGADETSQMKTLELITFNETGNAIVQTNVIAVDTAQTYHQVYCHNAIAGSGNVTYDISFDNGSTWDTGQALNTKNPRTSTTGTQMIVKLNLNGVGGGNTAEADDYGVMLYY